MVQILQRFNKTHQSQEAISLWKEASDLFAEHEFSREVLGVAIIGLGQEGKPGETSFPGIFDARIYESRRDSLTTGYSSVMALRWSSLTGMVAKSPRTSSESVYGNGFSCEKERRSER